MATVGHRMPPRPPSVPKFVWVAVVWAEVKVTPGTESHRGGKLARVAVQVYSKA